jgi:4-carboxymuconolactone decarboxylase
LQLWHCFLLPLLSYGQARKEAATPKVNAVAPALTSEDVRMVSPALDRYTQDRLMGDLWKRPDLSRRDRSIVTLAVLIARSQIGEMPY